MKFIFAQFVAKERVTASILLYITGSDKVRIQENIFEGKFWFILKLQYIYRQQRCLLVK